MKDCKHRTKGRNHVAIRAYVETISTPEGREEEWKRLFVQEAKMRDTAEEEVRSLRKILKVVIALNSTAPCPYLRAQYEQTDRYTGHDENGGNEQEREGSDPCRE